MISFMERETFGPGHRVISQGEINDKIFVVLTGAAEVKEQTWGEDNEILLLTLREGEYFGEQGFLRNCPRTVSVVAQDEAGEGLEVMSISRETYDTLGISLPNLMGAANNAHHRRAVAAGTGIRYKDSSLFRYLSDQDAVRSTDKSEEEYALCVQAIKDNKGLKATHKIHDSLQQQLVENLASEAWRIPCTAGKDVILEGDLDCEHFYIVSTGKFKSSFKPHAGGIEEKARKHHDVQYGPGDSFGF